MSDAPKEEKVDLFKDVTIPCKTAREFLDNLDPTHPRWSRENWIYRGQNDARWELLPSLFRNWNRDTNPGLELALIDLFIRNANLVNLPIPNNALDYASYAQKSTKRELTTGGSYDFRHVVFAIAQHSGVPTRLLDFTHNPMVAAYFAADYTDLFVNLGVGSDQLAEYFRQSVATLAEGGDLKSTVTDFWNTVNDAQERLPENIAVWAIQAQDIDMHTTLLILDHPYTEILPLKMQMGLFLCETEFVEIDVLRGQEWRSFDTKLLPLAQTNGIYKLTLPWDERHDLLELLRRNRIFYGSLLPSYQEVAKRTVELAYEMFTQRHVNSA